MTRIVTVRQALRKRCKGPGAVEVAINRRALKHLLAIAETAEKYRSAQTRQALLFVEQADVKRDTPDYETDVMETMRAARGAAASLDELLRVLESPA